MTLLILSVLALIFLAGTVFFLERRYLKKKTSETMSRKVWEDIIGEREETLRKRHLFRRFLKEARSGKMKG